MKVYLFLILLFTLFFVFVLPTYITYKKTKINPITFGKEDTAHNFVGNVFKVLIILLIITFIANLINENWYIKYFVPIVYLENKVLFYIGFLLLHFSIFWIFIAQMQMGTSWRIGIDEKNKTNLVTMGLFSVSRNPIFLGILVSIFGVFMILPNVFTFFIAFAAYIVIQIQIRLEEEFLLKEFGENYKIYKKNTRRIL